MTSVDRATTTIGMGQVTVMRVCEYMYIYICVYIYVYVYMYVCRGRRVCGTHDGDGDPRIATSLLYSQYTAITSQLHLSTMTTLYSLDHQQNRPLQALHTLPLLPAPLHRCIALDNGPQGKQVLLPAPELDRAGMADAEIDLKRQLDRWSFGPSSRASSVVSLDGAVAGAVAGDALRRSRSSTAVSSVSSAASFPTALTPPSAASAHYTLEPRDSVLYAAGAVPSTHTPAELQPKRVRSSIERRRKYVCKTCQKGFTTSGHLARHNRIHTGEKNHVCPFEGCGQRFSRHDNCVQHHKTHLR
ncbi:LADA_0B06612g1_1 [Lachancea dasiensis]|uniref:LADA_0B06612g1_1 n=1 Tax=Lachancea dasiensis TaxID=1072105 RepID=A0A1G4ITP2_9SACH|nr:LADA_0B06612g1_1 [Lachancea dasiensis]